MATQPMRHRPIFGGVFGKGRYSLASMPCVSKGLHAVRFMVIDPRSGSVLSVAEGKIEALSAARQVIRANQQVARQAALAALATAAQRSLWPEGELPADPGRRRPVSKRRREIFSKCDGRCHYCTKPLSLDGRWHIEHMVPRALDGGDELGNLVAACPSCNLAKSDRTALEFITSGRPIT